MDFSAQLVALASTTVYALTVSNQPIVFSAIVGLALCSV
jgi:hypothetical protein